MDNPPPLLSLSSEQVQVINAHAASAASMIIDTKFGPDSDSKDAAVNNIIFQQGMLHAYHALLVYDAETLKRAQEVT
jgi:hypothetical protein